MTLLKEERLRLRKDTDCILSSWDSIEDHGKINCESKIYDVRASQNGQLNVPLEVNIFV